MYGVWCHLIIFFFTFQATINIIFDRVGKVDPVTRGIEIAVNYFGIQFDVSNMLAPRSIDNTEPNQRGHSSKFTELSGS